MRRRPRTPGSVAASATDPGIRRRRKVAGNSPAVHPQVPAGTFSSVSYDGDAFGTRYGDVQVQITVQSGTITDVTILQVPWNDRHDQMINSQAVPIYNSEAVQAQSADIDVVSGATVTWEGYTQSLQSAIDKANI